MCALLDPLPFISCGLNSSFHSDSFSHSLRVRVQGSAPKPVKRKLVGLLKGRFLKLAKLGAASRFVEALFMWGDVPDKELIAQPLAEHLTEVKVFFPRTSTSFATYSSLRYTYVVKVYASNVAVYSVSVGTVHSLYTKLFSTAKACPGMSHTTEALQTGHGMLSAACSQAHMLLN